MTTTTTAGNGAYAEIDTLVSGETAFRSYAELISAMANGYVPTLNSKPRQLTLARLLREQGHRVFQTGRKATN